MDVRVAKGLFQRSAVGVATKLTDKADVERRVLKANDLSSSGRLVTAFAPGGERARVGSGR